MRSSSAALRLILDTGYNQVTLADIAEQVGVSKGLISYYFPRKEDVFLAVLEQIVGRLTADFEGFCTAEVPAPEKLMMIFNNLFGNEKRARRYYTVVIDYMAQAIRERQVREYTQLIYASYRTYMERIVDDGMAKGEFQPVDAPRVVSMILGMMEGLVLQWFFDPKGFDLDAAYEMCVDLMNTYLAPEGMRVDGRPRLHARGVTPPPGRGLEGCWGRSEGRVSNERCQAGTDTFEKRRAERFGGRLSPLVGLRRRNAAAEPFLDQSAVPPKKLLNLRVPWSELHPLRDLGDRRELAGQSRLEVPLHAQALLAASVGAESRGDAAPDLIVIALGDEPTEREKCVFRVHRGPPILSRDPTSGHGLGPPGGSPAKRLSAELMCRGMLTTTTQGTRKRAPLRRSAF